jgi:hypothetical protein
MAKRDGKRQVKGNGALNRISMTHDARVVHVIAPGCVPGKYSVCVSQVRPK